MITIMNVTLSCTVYSSTTIGKAVARMQSKALVCSRLTNNVVSQSELPPSIVSTFVDISLH
jgi:uncharacterized Zn finger protein